MQDGDSCGRSPVHFHLCPCAREVGSGEGQASFGFTRREINCHPFFWANRPEGVLVAEFIENEANIGGATGEETIGVTLIAATVDHTAPWRLTSVAC